jgi:hypothetical protein
VCASGGPKILLDSEPRAPAPPIVPSPARPPRRGPRSGWRRASLRRGHLPEKNYPCPAWLVEGWGGADSPGAASAWIIRDVQGTKVAYIRMKGVDQ